jgi:CDP-paratose 2-epimerase
VTRPVLITGGAGFVGANLASRYLRTGIPVIIYDNLSRAGVERNLDWLRNTYGPLVEAEIADIRDRRTLSKAVSRASFVFHFAAQVAVTTSLQNPLYDFDVNARGTLNLLEEVRSAPVPPPVLFTSTNKIYGALSDLDLEAVQDRYEPVGEEVRASGLSETRALDFHTPYGCSKGAADQMVLDYARTFNIHAVVFRMSCIYGPRQFGTEDQGWVAHFIMRALAGDPIEIFGDGMQVRDVLHVSDLVRAIVAAEQNIASLSGEAFNIGGGPSRAVSVLEVLDIIASLTGAPPAIEFSGWRSGDQRYYVSDTRKFESATGWQPRIQVQQGLADLYRWLLESRARGHALAGRAS